MKGNIVLAAAVFASGIIIASIILVFGIQSALNHAMLQIDASVRAHGKSVEKAGAMAGMPIREAIDSLSARVNQHATAVERAGKTISHLQLTVKNPVDIAQPIRIQGSRQDGSLPVKGLVNVAQPIRIQGPREDGSLPVRARIGK